MMVTTRSSALFQPLAAALAALLLASCAQNGAELSSATLAGKIRNWQGGEAVLSALVYDENGERVLATGSVGEEGSFTLVLPEAPSPELLENIVPDLRECQGLNVSVSEARVLLLVDLTASREGEPLGNAFQASTGTFGYGPPARGTVIVARLYSDRAFSVTGSCFENFTEATLSANLDLRAGWNQVYAEVTEASDSALEVTFGSGRLPPSVDWYIAHAPAPQPDDDLMIFFAVDPSTPGELGGVFHWSVYTMAGGVLQCFLDPGDGSPIYELGDCGPEGSMPHLYHAAGDYLAEFWVIDEAGNEARIELWLMVGVDE